MEMLLKRVERRDLDEVGLQGGNKALGSAFPSSTWKRAGGLRREHACVRALATGTCSWKALHTFRHALWSKTVWVGISPDAIWD